MGVKHKDAFASKMVTAQTDIFFIILLVLLCYKQDDFM